MAKNKNIPSKSMKFRARVLMTGFFILLFSGVIYTFFDISVIQNKDYQTKANDQHFGSIKISAHRGSIYDSKGTILAKSASVYKVYLDPKQFNDDMETLRKKIVKRKADILNGDYQPKVEITTNAEGEEEQVVITDDLPESTDKFREEAIKFLAEKLEIEPQEVSDAMDKESRYVVLQEQVEKPTADEILSFFNKNGFVCVNVEEDTKRYYPQNELAASVIGFTGADGSGMYGLEAYYDDYLSGTDGRTISAKDSNGNELPYRYSKTYPAKNGDDIYLTIDMNIQHYLEKHLEEMNEKFEVQNRSCAILMNPKTGAVYGMASCPGFDLNQPYKIADENIAMQIEQIADEDERNKITAEKREGQWKNKCLTEIYEPGSVFKVITSAAAIEENLIDFDNDNFYCSGRVELEGANAPIKCHQVDGHGDQTFQEALTHSCNPAFMEIGRRLGVDKFCYYFTAFGFWEKTGIDLPAESRGMGYRPTTPSDTVDTVIDARGEAVKYMSNVDLAVSSFGQGETVTPMEMITAYCAAINGGYLLKPYVVDKILDSDGNVVFKNERTVKRQVVSEDTSAKMRDALYHVVADNNGGNVTIKGYKIGGKSGTSQRLSITAQNVVSQKGVEEDDKDQEYGASYVCFTPADDPELILLVLADMPNKELGYFGSKVAVPTARDILTEVLPYLGISPEYTDEELANLDIKVPILEGSVSDAIATLEGLGIEYEKIGEGTTVVAQSPKTGSSIAKGGKVYLYTESSHTVDYTEVPNLIGLTPSMANEAIVWKQLNYVARGASVMRDDCIVSGQYPEAGAKVPVGSTVELEFLVNSDGD